MDGKAHYLLQCVFFHCCHRSSGYLDVIITVVKEPPNEDDPTGITSALADTLEEECLPVAFTGKLRRYGRQLRYCSSQNYLKKFYKITSKNCTEFFPKNLEPTDDAKLNLPKLIVHTIA